MCIYINRQTDMSRTHIVKMRKVVGKDPLCDQIINLVLPVVEQTAPPDTVYRLIVVPSTSSTHKH